MKKHIGRTIAYVASVGSLLVGAFVCFGVAKNIKSHYDDYEVKIADLEGKGESITPTEQEELNKYYTLRDTSNETYKGFAVPSYVLSIAALVALGVCLHISDKAKEKEEKIPGLNA